MSVISLSIWMAGVIVQNITKSLNGFKIENLSFEVSEGEIFGLLGPNGAGKTTTIRMLVGLIKPDSGLIKVLGKNPSDVKDKIGYLPEERGLYRKMKVRDVLEYLGSLKGRADPDYWLKLFGMEDVANKKVEVLSKGMQQKVQLIATIQHDPEVLILDEPFSGLDPINVDFVRNLIFEMKEKGKTIILSTHMLNLAERLCDKILLINKGRCVLYGYLSEIKSRYDSVIEVEYIEDGTLKREVTNLSLKELVELGLDIRKYTVREPTLEEIFLREVKK